MDNNESINHRDIDAIQREITEIKGDVKEIRDGVGNRLSRLERDNIYVRGFLGALGVVIGVPALVGSGLGAVWFLKLLTGH